MTIVFITLFVLLAIYICALIWMAIGFSRTAPLSGSLAPVNITIIVCARNEEKNIGRCLRGILAQQFTGRIQLLVINDASSDNTVAQAELALAGSRINYKVVTNPVKKGKKQCITYAVQLAEHELVVLRDADTFVTSEKWLREISDMHVRTGAGLIIGPVAIADNYGLLWALQAIENNVLAVLACGSAHFHRPFLCSGANLAFTKKSFAVAGGFNSHRHIASGDDVLLMEDVKKAGLPVHYLKSPHALVYTYPAWSLKSLVAQRIRWAAKFRHNDNFLNLFVAALTFLVNLSWLFCLVAAYIDPAFKEEAMLFILIKISTDLLLLFLASGFIKNKRLEWYALPVACVYPVYAVMVSIGTLVTKPNWK